jgi:hypothetical protein
MAVEVIILLVDEVLRPQELPVSEMHPLGDIAISFHHTLAHL